MARRAERAVSRPGEPARMPAQGRVCGDERGPAGCASPVFSRGMCRRHYRRAAKGLPVDDGQPERGAPSGYGRYGILDTDSGGRLLCHECGHWYVALGVHIGMRHGPTRDYRLTHGIPLGWALTSPDLRQRRADTARQDVQRLADVRRTDIAERVDPEIQLRGTRLGRRHTR